MIRRISLRFPRLFQAATLALILARAAAAPPPAAAAEPPGPPPVQLAPPSDNSYQRLGDRFGELLRDLDWADGTVAVLIQDADYPVKAFGLNESTPMEPAGVLQLVTAAAALDRIGPDFRFSTTLGLSGAVQKRELTGNIVVTGDGDPTISALLLKKPDAVWELFDQWAKLLRKQNIKKISGAIIADDRAFDDQLQAPGWPLDKLGDPALPSVSALNFNHNCVDILWQKGTKLDQTAQCLFFPDLPKYTFLANKVKLAAAAPRPRQYTRDATSNVITATGLLPLKTTAHDRATIHDPARYFAEALKARLIQDGIEVTGPAITASKNSPVKMPDKVNVLETHASPPLSQILTEMLHHDLALNAEVVFKTLGRRATNRPGSFASGEEVVRAYADQLHLPGSRWSFADGSGRSRTDRIAPSQLLSLMRAVRRKGGAAGRLETLLPRAWEPGALAERFKPLAPPPPADPKAAKLLEQKKAKEKAKGPKDAPPIWAASGSADGVAALAGYVDTRFKRRLAFAIMVNGSRLPAEVLRYQIDSLVQSLAE